MTMKSTSNNGTTTVNNSQIVTRSMARESAIAKKKPLMRHHRLLISIVLHALLRLKEHQVLTLGDIKKRWRMIKCQHPHYPATTGLFMNDIVYYGAWSNSHEGSFVVAFDMRLEDFSIVKLPEGVRIRPNGLSDFVKYNKKIALVDQTFCGQLDLWILEDDEKHEWSKINVVVPSWNDLVGQHYFHCIGTIGTGELVFAPCYSINRERYFIVCYDLKEGVVRRVVIERFGEPFASGKFIFLDHVENLMIL
ncbi:hypothetical protein AALP_AA3G149800 [Arabis alpina]|uniref:F-box associated beta-propeller type 3 domain-containing protein n=1 Tax=Arabis alpina TaxID=50452 RepID=A0A087H9A9_ARAAL|nr:hypothetical protein AALP_AA3G149800 [Arabis alpina]